MKIKLKRAYDRVESSDGYRILVDRIWPRGVSRETLQIGDWLKHLAPSEELRRWFDHDSDKFEEFRRRYKTELDSKSSEIEYLLSLAENHETLSLVYSARDKKHNNAVVLKEYLQGKIS